MSRAGDVRDDCVKLITSEMDDLRVENRRLYYLILELILDLNELEDACGRPSRDSSLLRVLRKHLDRGNP
jgi:hypothetical protein